VSSRGAYIRSDTSDEVSPFEPFYFAKPLRIMVSNLILFVQVLNLAIILSESKNFWLEFDSSRAQVLAWPIRIGEECHNTKSNQAVDITTIKIFKKEHLKHIFLIN